MKRESSIAHWHIGDHDPKCEIKAFEATNQENSIHQSTWAGHPSTTSEKINIEKNQNIKSHWKFSTTCLFVFGGLCLSLICFKGNPTDNYKVFWPVNPWFFEMLIKKQAGDHPQIVTIGEPQKRGSKPATSFILIGFLLTESFASWFQAVWKPTMWCSKVCLQIHVRGFRKAATDSTLEVGGGIPTSSLLNRLFLIICCEYSFGGLLTPALLETSWNHWPWGVFSSGFGASPVSQQKQKSRLSTNQTLLVSTHKK